MKYTVLFFALILRLAAVFSQTFYVGHKQMMFVDSTRSNRAVSTEIYYPAGVAGNNVPAAQGIFPVLAFGHGFVMSVSSYQTVWDSLVPHGYILVFPATEGGFSPSHSEFGKDLAFLLNAMKKEGPNPASPFYGIVGSTSAVMGHSMGGGAAFLAVQYDSTITALATLAAAETTPSAVTAAMQINKPALVISGANDCVAPPVQHQQPMYDSLASACKTFVNVIGGSHCQFADYSSTCYFGEGTCTPQAAITANAQRQLTMGLMISWLNFYLKADCNAGTSFQGAVLNNSLVNTQQNCGLQCISTVFNEVEGQTNIQIYPNPCSDEVMIEAGGMHIVLTDIAGRRLVEKRKQMSGSKIDTSGLKNGVYFINCEGAGGAVIRKKLIVQHAL